MARIAERSASRPIWEPDPSSPSANPRPPMMVSVASNARDRRRAGAGDHQPAVRAGVRADAGGGRVVRRAHEPKAGKSRRHSRLVASLLEPGEPETHCDRPPIDVAEPGLSQSLVDDRAHSRDRGGKIDMNVRRRAVRLGKRSSVGVAQPRAAVGRAAIDSEKERRAGHAASPSFDRSSIAVAAARSASAASAGVSRFAFAPGGDLLGRHWQMHKDGGDRRPLVAKILQGPEVEMVADKCAGVPSTCAPEFPPR